MFLRGFRFWKSWKLSFRAKKTGQKFFEGCWFHMILSEAQNWKLDPYYSGLFVDFLRVSNRKTDGTLTPMEIWVLKRFYRDRQLEVVFSHKCCYGITRRRHRNCCELFVGCFMYWVDLLISWFWRQIPPRWIAKFDTPNSWRVMQSFGMFFSPGSKDSWDGSLQISDHGLHKPLALDGRLGFGMRILSPIWERQGKGL